MKLNKPTVDTLLEELSGKVLKKFTGKEESDSAILEEQTSINEQDKKDRVQDRSERKRYAFRTFLFLCVFTGVILSVVIADGFSKIIPFSLSDNVLMILIGTSFASVISIFAFVMKYLFKKN